MTFFQRLLVLHAHPTKLIFEIIGGIWAVYFLWNQNWFWALIIGLGLPILGSLLVWKEDAEKLAQTTLGRVFLVHAHPLNILMHLVGGGIAIYGLWTHWSAIILAGVTVIVAGHFWGWKK